MEGFECKLVSSASWPFDPLSQELLLLQKTPLEHSHNKLLAFSTLNLNTSSLSPFDLNLNLPPEGESETISTSSSSSCDEDINNNSGLIGVSFLTLDPLQAEEVPGPGCTSSHSQDHSRSSILRSCFPPEDPCQRDKMPEKRSSVVHETRLLPKFEEIHFVSESTGNPSHSQNPSSHDHGEVDVDDVDGIYFSIQDLDQYDRDGKGYLIEDLMDDSTPTDGVGGLGSTDFLRPPDSTLDIDLLVDDDDTEDTLTEAAIPSNSNSFDHYDVSLEEEEDKGEADIDTYSMELELTPPLHIPDGGDDGEKQELKCKFCGFICCSKSSLGIHERRHTGERPYACKFCGRLFNSAQCCKHHERLHTGDKPFECQYCGKKYAVSTRLKRHERVHTREEPYKCGEPGCGKTFRWFDAFRDHRNTHNGVPLYLCSVCGKSFTSYLKFYYHERGHFLKRERDRDRDRAKRALQLQTQQNGGVPSKIPTQPPSKTPKKGRAGGKTTPKGKSVLLGPPKD